MLGIYYIFSSKVFLGHKKKKEISTETNLTEKTLEKPIIFSIADAYSSKINK